MGDEQRRWTAVTLALELGGDVNALDASGESALHGAAYRGANTIVRFLVDRGAEAQREEQPRLDAPLTIAEGVYSGNFNAFPTRRRCSARSAPSRPRPTCGATPRADQPAAGAAIDALDCRQSPARCDCARWGGRARAI